MSDRKDAIRSELITIRKKNGGVLSAENTVEFAKDPDTALHNEFEWDDSIAGHQHRLWQARQIFRVYPTMIQVNRETIVVHPEYVSFKRNEYRPVVEILSDEELSNQLLRQTIVRLASIKEVALFPELNKVAKAIKAAEEKYLDQ